jgi:ABC-type transporter Mla subunit MlaD
MAERGSRASFWVGLGTGVVLATVVLWSIWYVPRKGLDPFRDSLVFHVLFAQAHGLTTGDPVLLNGVEVGEVRGVTVRDVPDVGVRAVVSVEVFDPARWRDLLRYDSGFTVGRQGLLGRRAIDVAAGGVAAPIEAGAVVPGREPFDPMVIVTDLQATVAELRSLLAGDEPGSPDIRRALRDLELTLRNIREFSEKLR